MPSYKLTYFATRCRAEPIHLIFHTEGVKYEFEVIGDNWLQVKPTLPLGQVPVLQVDGVKLTQSRAIIRYLGREFDYYGSNTLEAAQIDCALDAMDDIILKAGKIYYHKGFPGFQGPQDVLENFFKSRSDAIDEYQQLLRKLMSDVHTLFLMVDGDFLVGNKLSIADMFFFAATNFARFFVEEPFDEFPKLAALHERIITHPKVSNYLTETGYKPYQKFKRCLMLD